MRKPTKVVGKGFYPCCFVWTGGEGTIFEGCPSVFVDDCVGEEFGVDNMGCRSDVPPLQRAVLIIRVVYTGYGITVGTGLGCVGRDKVGSRIGGVRRMHWRGER